MSTIDLLVIIFAVLFVLVLLDGLRRKWSNRSRVVVRLDRSIPGGDVADDDFTRAELPNGGARTKLRSSDELPRPPRSGPKLKAVQTAQQRREQAQTTAQLQSLQPQYQSQPQPRDVPVLLDAVELEEELIEHTNVFADSSAVPVVMNQERVHGSDGHFGGFGGEQGETGVDTTEEEAMGIYQEDIDEVIDGLDEEFIDLTADLSAERPLVAGKGGDDDEDEWEEEWEEEEDEDEDEEDDAEEEDGEFWEETWDEEEDEDEDEDDELEDDDEYDDEDEDDEADEEDEYENEEDEEDEEDDEEDEEEEDEYESFPGYDDEEDEAWNRSRQPAVGSVSTPPQHARHSQSVPSAPRHAPSAARERIEPRMESSDLDVWDFDNDAVTAFDAPGADLDVDDLDTGAAVARESMMTADAGNARGVHERKAGFGAGFGAAFLSRKDQGELFREEQRAAAAAEVDADQPDTNTPQEVIVINVMARPGRLFEGYDLLPVLQLQGLRLGEMSIFHKHSGANGSGSVVFSMANMVKPGTFDLSTMDSFVTPGVSFFLQLPNKYGNMAGFEQMLTAATALKHALDGELKDENRSVLTRQTLEHYRQRIRDFELTLLSARR